MAIYGRRRLGVFSPVVEIRSNGFTSKGKQYVWADVKEIEIMQGSGIPLWGQPDTLLVRLRNGAHIEIQDVAFEKQEEPLMAGYSCAFDEVVALFKAATRIASRVIA